MRRHAIGPTQRAGRSTLHVNDSESTRSCNRPGHFFDSAGVFHGAWEPTQPDGTGPVPRDFEGKAHPFPATCWWLADAVKRLRAFGANLPDANTPVDLWRGMKNMDVTDTFMIAGGTEAAPTLAHATEALTQRRAPRGQQQVMH